MKAILRASLILLTAITATTIATAKTALPPLVVTGDCPAGSSRTTKWMLFEDLDGNGTYDWIVFGDCDGTVRGHSWSVSSDPTGHHPDDIPIGQLPDGIAGVGNPTLSYEELPSGLHSWTVTERLPSGAVICSYSRNADMSLSSSCPPDGNFH